MKQSKKRIIGVGLVVAALTVATYAFTAANVVPATKAGDGSGTITGYTVSAVHYELNATDPKTIDAVEFTLNSAPVAGSTVKVRLDSGGSWYDCAMTVADAVCDTTGVAITVADADSLNVVAAD